MLRPEEIERLSQLLAGELPDAEADALHAELEKNPELQQAWHRLASLQLLSDQLASPSMPVERAIARSIARKRVAPWLLAAAAAGIAAAWLFWPAPVIEQAALVVETAPFKLQAGSEVKEEGEKVYRLVKGTALFDGTMTVKVDDETLQVRGRALISKDPSEALAHVTDLVTPTPEVVMMISEAKAKWLTAAMAVMVFSGEVQAQEKVPAGKTLAKAARATPTVVKAWPAEKKTPPPPSDVFDVDALNTAVVVQGGALSKCFEAGLKQNPKLGGKLTALLTISSTGKLEDTTVGEDTLQNPFVTSCVLQAMQQVKFPPPKDVERAQVAYPMEFAARGGTGSELVLPTGKGCDSCKFISDRTEKVDIDAGSSPFTGPADAKVTVILFSEAECSFCVKAHAVLKVLQVEYAGKVKFVFKHRPLSAHPGARKAALALHAAHAQGKFWELLDRAYNTPTSTEGGLYDAQARSLGLDLQRYRRDVESPATAEAIDADLALAEKLGVKGVPAWFINGQEIVGYRPLDVMKKAIDAALVSP